MKSVDQALRGYRFHITDEAELQEAIAEALTAEGVPFVREHSLGGDRVDFFLDGLALEVKTQGSAPRVFAQLARYAEHPSVESVVLVTSRRSHARIFGPVNGKPLTVIVKG